MGTVEVPLNELFDIDKAGGKAIYTKAYCKAHSGDVPVYGASSVIPLGYIDKADYPEGLLTWARNGLAGYITLMREPFCITADRGVLIPRPEISDQLNVNYIKYVSEPLFRSNIKGRLGDNGKNEYTKLHPSMIRDILIPMPVKEDGSYDYEEQCRLAGKYEMIDEKKAQILDEVYEIINKSPEIALENMVEAPLKDIVSFDTVFLRMNRTDLNSFPNEGDVPVYSADANVIYNLQYTDELSSRLNEASESSPALSLATNGDGSAGRNFFIHKKPFGITADRIVLKPLRDDIDVSYLRYQLNDIKERYGFNREHKALRPYIQDIPVRLPIMQDGSYDLLMQQRLASKYEQIELHKTELLDHVKRINKVTVIID